MLLQAIKAMVQSATQKVKVDGKFGDEFDTFLGVKQGDPQNTHWPAGLSWSAFCN